MAEQPSVPLQAQEARSLKRILVVDDNSAIVTLFSAVLERHGYETAAAYSGEEAIHVASSFQPDFILSDVVMGGMNGVDAATEILRHLPKCKVLFMSGAGYIEPLEKARLQGFTFEFLSKPISASELLAEIAHVFSTEGNDAAQTVKPVGSSGITDEEEESLTA
jgi:CheY-like chemotaxis protein